jgi:thermitase
MKTLLPLLLSAALLPTMVLAQTTSPVRLLLKPRPEVLGLQPLKASTTVPTAFGVAAADQLNTRFGASQRTVLNPGSPAPDRVSLLILAPGTVAAEAVRAYQATGLFEFVEADAEGHSGGVQGLTPTDAQYSRQWGLNNNGSFTLSSARAGADIKMEDAWTISTGSPNVVVATIDSGLRLVHPEFAGRLWVNPGEIAGNNIDDDSNGFVDDINGWSFVTNTNAVADDYGHGTNVTGIIGANGNNALGYAGVDWQCKLMTLKGLNSMDFGLYSWWASSIYYAADNGAKVINMSLAGTTPSAAMQTAVNYAYARGVNVVVCMGNVNSAALSYPGALTNVLAVGSTNPNDNRTNPFFWSATSGSSYGPHISVVAPGNYIYGLDYLSNTNYNSYWGGTSQATPHVAGLVSLLLAQNPARTPQQIRSLIETTADDLVGNRTEDLPGWDQFYGWGRVNAYRALRQQLTPTAPARLAAQVLLLPNPAHGQLTVHTPAAAPLAGPIVLRDALGREVSRQAATGGRCLLALPPTPGLYWVSLPLADGVVTRRVVVE